jgi:hypothetical protein
MTDKLGRVTYLTSDPIRSIIQVVLPIMCLVSDRAWRSIIQVVLPIMCLVSDRAWRSIGSQIHSHRVKANS